MSISGITTPGHSVLWAKAARSSRHKSFLPCFGHTPTGAQGMNTGIQDAINLAWKLALAVRGNAADGLLETYDAERRPVGEEVVGRTVEHARSGFGDPSDAGQMILREAQLLVGYPDSPLVAETGELEAGPLPGQRAPDARGLIRSAVAFPASPVRAARWASPHAARGGRRGGRRR